FGPYRLAALLGAGGMGDVYRAARVDGQYEQQVALKVVRSGYARGLTARFRNERQILASLEHPNIARILDGGTTKDGVPYIVMELIEGLPMTEYCDQHKLRFDDRLKLFRTVCSAVHYAHQHLVVHRDIKPSNILVTADGTPKLLDFGIAKILRPESIEQNATHTGLLMMTPEYASPEQLRGELITTATDIYSLGLVLYELLTGHPAFRMRGNMPHEIARGVLEMEPERPSEALRRRPSEAQNPAGVPSAGEKPDGPREKLGRPLVGDLDSIVLKALRKEPGDRYGSADQLSEDIRRHLEGLPVSAREGTLSYRVSKYVLRHKAGVASVALIFLTLVTGIIVTVREARIAQRNELRAEKRFNDVRKLANSLLFEIHDSVRDLPGSTPARKLIVENALRYLDSLSSEAAGDISLQRDLATAYERIGDVEGSQTFANLGETAGAVESYRKALAIRQEVTAGEHSRSDEAALGRAYVSLAMIYKITNDFSGAMDALQRAYLIAEKLAREDQKDPKLQEDFGAVCFALGQAFANLGDLAHSVEYYRKSITIREAITGGSPQFQTYVKSRLAGSYGYLSGVVRLSGDTDQAIALQTKARDILAELSAADPNNATLRQFLLQCEFWIGYYLNKKNALVQALPHLQVAIDGYQKLLAADPKDTLAAGYLARCYTAEGTALAAGGQPTEAIRSGRKGVQILEALTTKDPSDTFNKLTYLAYAQAGVADAYSRRAQERRTSNTARRSDWLAARTWYEKSLATWSQTKQRGPLGKFDEAEPERIANELARCNAKTTSGREKP
ncbi:MAG: protein kinase domain-containing protein, partial [Terriglobales bacterium]